MALDVVRIISDQVQKPRLGVTAVREYLVVCLWLNLYAQ